MSDQFKTPTRRGVLATGAALSAAAAPALLPGPAPAAYAKYWKDMTGQDLVINQSHGDAGKYVAP